MPSLIHDLFAIATANALLLSIVVSLSLPLGYVFYNLYLHPLASIPGPFSAKLSRLWMVKHSFDGNMPTTMIDLHNKYGDLVRTGPNELSVADLTSVRIIYGAGSKFRKSDWYSVIQGRRKFDLFPERNVRVHAEQRKLVSRAYSMDSMKKLEQYVNSTIQFFFECMDQRKDQVVDFGYWIQLFAFDVIGEITFSKRIGFLDAGDDSGTFNQIKRIVRSGAWLGQVPAVFWIHDAFEPYIGNFLDVNKRHGALRQFAMREIAGRKDRGSDREDILSRLYTMQKEKPKEIDDTTITSVAASNLNAGSDTTAISIRAIIYHLLKNPEAKRKLVAEIDERRREGRLSDVVTLTEADSMPYLQAVMYEALRLHPAVGFSMPRVVPAEGFTIGAKFLPAGTVVGANAWVVHQNKQIYGDDVEAFRPERWMMEDNGDMHRFFLTFGSGARFCLGRNISWMEMSKLVPTLFLHYDLELSDPNAKMKTTTWFFAMNEGLNVRLRRRQP